jgi:hypothetical protein
MMKFDSIVPQKFDITAEGGRLNSLLAIAPEPRKVESAAKELGVEVKVTAKNDGSMSFAANDLSRNIELETERYGVITLAEAVKFAAQQPNGNLRCQTPYRDSDSYAAFLSVNAEGNPYLHDTGTGTTHWLENKDCISTPVISTPEFNYADLSNLKASPPPPRLWAINEWAPLGSVVALFSPGGLGKTLLAQLFATHITAGITIFGQGVIQGSVLGYLCEDDNDEIRRRQDKINDALQISETPAGLYIEGRAGKNNTLFTFASQHQPSPTELLQHIKTECANKKPVFVIFDNIAQIYAGMENDRHQVTVFCNELTGIAQQFNCCVLLLGHTAKAEGSQYSGSTAWEAAVRTRLWLNRNDDGTMELRKAKANYSGLDSVTLQWQDGYLHTISCGAGGANIVNERAKTAVAIALNALTKAKISTSNSPQARNYLPKLMLDGHKLNGITPQTAKTALAAMVESGEIVPNSDLGWKTSSRHPATGLKLADDKRIVEPENVI